jgi:UDP-glucose 4-epimerase
MKVLVTGGAGYIGSTICSALEEESHTPVILDSLVNGREEFTKGKIFYKGDIADRKLLEKIFKEHPDIKYTIHCAALIIVPESVEKPHEYYKNNVAKSIELFKNLKDLGCKNILFSSSAALYDATEDFRVTEESPIKPTSPYARTKYMMELILKDYCDAYDMRGISLRYFNPIGADPKMRSGMYVKNPSHVLSKMLNVALGKEEVFNITGTDWPTKDGTGIRDYIHVWDLAKAHVKAIKNFESAFAKSGKDEKYMVINIGVGRGITVKELVETFEKVYGKKLNKQEKPPRPGDVAGAFADATKAKELLGWESEHNLEDAIRDAFKWREEREKILNW